MVRPSSTEPKVGSLNLSWRVRKSPIEPDGSCALIRVCGTSAAGDELRHVGNKATYGVLLKRTAHPGVYRRGAQLIEERTSSLRLQRWMGHRAAAYTLETYGHLINDELGKPLELKDSASTSAGGRTDARRTLALTAIDCCSTMRKQASYEPRKIRSEFVQGASLGLGQRYARSAVSAIAGEMG
jgi:hypothetical protein